MKSKIILGLMCLAITTLTVGQEAPPVSAQDLTFSAADIIGRLDLDVPDSPGFAILGIAPQNVINPDTPAELATALFLGDDSSGNPQEGLSIEFRPYLMAKGQQITVADYYHNQWLSRATLSISKSKGSDQADRSNRQAVGFTFTPIDDRDPLTSKHVDNCLTLGLDNVRPLGDDFKSAVRTATRNRLTSATPDQQSPEEVAAVTALSEWLSGGHKTAVEETTDKCLQTHKAETVNARQLQLGIAYHDSQVEDISESGTALWVSYAEPLMGGSLTAHARYSNDVLVADPENSGQYFLKNEAVVAMRFRKGDDRRAVLFEASYVDEEYDSGRVNDAYSTALIGVEFRLLDELWIQLAFGDTFGSNQDKDLALSGQFRWAASKNRLWNTAKK